MSLADVIGILAFLAFVLLGLFAMTVQDALRKRPRGRVRSRLDHVMLQNRNPGQDEMKKALERMQRAARRRQRRQAMGLIGDILIRIETVSGQRGTFLLGLAATLGAVGAAVAGFILPISLWVWLLAIPVVSLLAGTVTYRYLVERFRVRFLAQFPDVIDMIIRGIQAGVPVTQTLSNVGQEFDWPAGPEFTRMGESLQLGNDMEAVLDEAEQRVGIPDFSFLSVTLQLQRETGGSLSETLDNLATVVRARRDLRLKARALTAEGRLSGNIIAAIPFFILGFLSFVNPDYIGTLFNTEAGRRLLIVAAIMLVLGIALIRKLSRLEV
ncbi:MAG: type II secretion system F family protein [Castellaniella sp.]